MWVSLQYFLQKALCIPLLVCSSVFFSLGLCPSLRLMFLVMNFSPLNLGKKWHSHLIVRLASYRRKTMHTSTISPYTCRSFSLRQLPQWVQRQVIQVLVMPACIVQMEILNQLLLASLWLTFTQWVCISAVNVFKGAGNLQSHKPCHLHLLLALSILSDRQSPGRILPEASPLLGLIRCTEGVCSACGDGLHLTQPLSTVCVCWGSP